VSYRLYEAPFAVLWLAWLAYWIVAAANVKAVRRREASVTRFFHVALSVLAAALLAWPVRWLPWLDRRFLPPTMSAYWPGLIMVAAGIAFAVRARHYLGRNWSGTVTVKQDHELIRTGPYRLVRHPIYTGLLLAILGTVIAFGEWRGLLAFASLSGSLLFKLRVEEHFMSESFPKEYARYRADVPALIPRIDRARATKNVSD